MKQRSLLPSMLFQTSFMETSMRETRPLGEEGLLRSAAPSASIPLQLMLEDLAQLAMSLEDVLDDLERGRGALCGLECWCPEMGDTPEDQALLQRVAQAKAAIPRVRKAVRQEICGPLRPDLLLLAQHVGNPPWRILEPEADQEHEGVLEVPEVLKR